MRAALIAGVPACLGLCLAAGIVGASVLALAGLMAGMGLLVIAVEHPKRSNWPAGELDDDHGRRSG